MLYDPKWDVDQRFTVAALTAWLETKPVDETYNVFDLGHCLLGQYLRHIGWCEADICNKSDDLVIDRDDFRRIAISRSFDHTAYTFGAALARARALTNGQRQEQGNQW